MAELIIMPKLGFNMRKAKSSNGIKEKEKPSRRVNLFFGGNG